MLETAEKPDEKSTSKTAKQNCQELYPLHLEKVRKTFADALEKHQFEHLLLFAGTDQYYFKDDRAIAFVSTPMFRYLCPASGTGHLLHFSPGKKPKLFYYTHPGFWEKPQRPNDGFWEEFFEIVLCDTIQQGFDSCKDLSNVAYIGPEHPGIQESWSVNPSGFTAWLNWQRSYKTPYEVSCISEANRIASLGHSVAHTAFLSGKSELDAHLSYLSAIRNAEPDLPYTSIIGFNEHAGILHYQQKDPQYAGSTMLIDAGAQFQGYAADITRTYTNRAGLQVGKDGGIPGETQLAHFAELLEKMNTMQKELCAEAKPGVTFASLHEKAHVEIAKILVSCSLIQNISPEAAFESQLSNVFFPHGLGHFLGLQVHDVAGKQKDEEGNVFEEGKLRFLRNFRPIEQDQVFTIEPGLYFIPSLIEKAKADPKQSSHLNLKVIEGLLPTGGIRVEDNIHVVPDGNNNLTRNWLS